MKIKVASPESIPAAVNRSLESIYNKLWDSRSTYFEKDHKAIVASIDKMVHDKIKWPEGFFYSVNYDIVFGYQVIVYTLDKEESVDTPRKASQKTQAV